MQETKAHATVHLGLVYLSDPLNDYYLPKRKIIVKNMVAIF